MTSKGANREKEQKKSLGEFQGESGPGNPEGRENGPGEIGAKHQVHPNQVTQWKKQLLERAAEVFGGKREEKSEEDIAQLYAKLGELTVERDFLSRVLGK